MHNLFGDTNAVHVSVAHSPYIVNHLNVLLRAGYFEKARENYPFLEKDNIAVYRVHEGTLTSLMATDNDTEEYGCVPST